MILQKERVTESRWKVGEVRVMDETIKRLMAEIQIADYHGESRVTVSVQLLRDALKAIQQNKQE